MRRGSHLYVGGLSLLRGKAAQMTDISEATGEPDAARLHGQGQVGPQGHQPAHGGFAFAPTSQGNNAALVLLIVAGVSTLVGCFPAVPAAVLGILGVIHQRESPSRAAKFTRWGWITYAIGVALMAAAAAALMLVAVYAASGNN